MNTIRENSKEVMKSKRNVSTGKPIANTKKKRISPKPNASNKLIFILNLVYTNRIKSNIRIKIEFIEICRKNNCCKVC
ncbi:hypothetical protein T190820D02B_50315 [Tenacibaculum sp. 190524A05c]